VINLPRNTVSVRPAYFQVLLFIPRLPTLWIDSTQFALNLKKFYFVKRFNLTNLEVITDFKSLAENDAATLGIQREVQYLTF